MAALTRQMPGIRRLLGQVRLSHSGTIPNGGKQVPSPRGRYTSQVIGTLCQLAHTIITRQVNKVMISSTKILVDWDNRNLYVELGFTDMFTCRVMRRLVES